MKSGSLLRVVAIQMSFVLVLFFVIHGEAAPRGGGGRGGGGHGGDGGGSFSREGAARGGGFSPERQSSSGARGTGNIQGGRGAGTQLQGGAGGGQRGTTTQNQAQRQQARQTETNTRQEGATPRTSANQQGASSRQENRQNYGQNAQQSHQNVQQTRQNYAQNAQQSSQNAQQSRQNVAQNAQQSRQNYGQNAQQSWQNYGQNAQQSRQNFANNYTNTYGHVGPNGVWYGGGSPGTWGGYYAALATVGAAGVAIGASVASLPPQSAPVAVQGKQYYYSGGVYYAPAPEGNGYAVVQTSRNHWTKLSFPFLVNNGSLGAARHGRSTTANRSELKRTFILYLLHEDLPPSFSYALVADWDRSSRRRTTES